MRSCPSCLTLGHGCRLGHDSCRISLDLFVSFISSYGIRVHNSRGFPLPQSK